MAPWWLPGYVGALSDPTPKVALCELASDSGAAELAAQGLTSTRREAIGAAVNRGSFLMGFVDMI